LYGWTWVEVAKRETCDAATRHRAIEEARWVLAHLESEEGLRPFDAAIDPPFGAFAIGYRAWLRGGLLMVTPASERPRIEIEAYEKDCAAIALALRRSGPFICSYHNEAWPCDAVVGAAALRLHDRLFSPMYAATIAEWVSQAKGRAGAEMLPHRWDPGMRPEPARGTSQAVFGRFLVEVDEPWGRAEYDRFRSSFVTTRCGIWGVREYQRGMSGPADVDSGPLLAGVSASASVFALGAANVHGDAQLADALLRSSECVGLPLEWSGSKRYMLGTVPVGDAFLAWAKSSTRWTGEPGGAAYVPIVGTWWKWQVHGWSALLLLALWAGTAWRFVRRRREVVKKFDHPKAQCLTQERAECSAQR
jgi:hypothetical protein